MYYENTLKTQTQITPRDYTNIQTDVKSLKQIHITLKQSWEFHKQIKLGVNFKRS